MAKYKSLILLILVFATIYSFLIILVSPFLLSWGDKPNFIGKTIDFLMSFPINWKALITEKSLLYVFPNGVFWGCIIAAVLQLIKKVF